MTCIQSQKNWFTGIKRAKKMFPSYLELEKIGSYLFRTRQTLLQLFEERKKWIPATSRLKNVVHNC